MFCIGCVISTVYECRVFGITQSDIVHAFIKSIDKDCGELSGDTVSRIINGSKNPSSYVMEALSKLSEDSYGDIVEYFETNIVRLIRENERTHARDALVLMIRESDEIENETVVEIISGIQKAELWRKTDNLSAFTDVR